MCAVVLSVDALRAEGAGTTTYTPVLMSNMSPPVAFEGTDGKFHLVYEIMIANFSRFKMKVTRLEIVDSDKSQRVLASWQDDKISSVISLLGQPAGIDTLGPSQSAIGWLFATVDGKSDLPNALSCRLTVVPNAPPSKTMPRLIVSTSDNVVVDQSPPLSLSSPLDGKRWVAVNAISNDSSHRRAMLPLNGELYTSQRYAIDFIQLDKDGVAYKGDPKKCDNYAGYDAKVYAAADGVVVESVDKFENQVPGKLPSVTLEEIAGNHLVIDFGGKRCALYAHLKPGSVKVKEGDRVTRGQELARLGNTGNTTAPHLHFHIMSGTQPLVGNGLPYYFDSFNYEGEVESIDSMFQAIDKEKPVSIVKTAAGERHNQLPIGGAIVDFK